MGRGSVMEEAAEAAARRLLRAEILRIVTDEKAAGTTLRTDVYAAILAATHPNANLQIDDIVNELAVAADREGVMVVISRPSARPNR
jgi:hypothetical protein